ncbi:hypothetical protein ACNJX9_34400 [Bradyrhizobium sp. DASA03076]|uniref:hypothetical protein n=1 Tax=Bradyrhizobium sp. BLXBL-03 TaxID=3395916 RepID=UPI003F70F361
MGRPKNNLRPPNALAECSLLAVGPTYFELPLPTERHAPVALVVAAIHHLSELQGIDRSKVHVVKTEFERIVSLAVKHQPDLILVACPPVGEALKACQCLLKNPSMRNIPIFLISMGYDTFPHGQLLSPVKEEFVTADDRYVTKGKRQKRLTSILNLLRYAEAEIAELDLEISAALLGAAIADIARQLD